VIARKEIYEDLKSFFMSQGISFSPEADLPTCKMAYEQMDSNFRSLVGKDNTFLPLFLNFKATFPTVHENVTRSNVLKRLWNIVNGKT